MKLVSIAILLLLTGCTRSLNSMGTPTMEADPSEQGGEGIMLINELARAYVKLEPGESPLCDYTKPSYQEADKYTYTRHDGRRGEAEDKFRCFGFRPVPPGDEGRQAVATHLKAGFALSDLYCDTFFRRIAKHSNQRRFARNTTNDVGAAVSTVLGLVTAGSGLTGGAGAGFALADSLFRNYDDNFLVTPDLQTLQPKVRSEQDKYRGDVAAAMPTNYFDANSMIIRYANLCSYTGMKALLNEAVVRSTVTRTMAETTRAFQVSAATAKEELEALIAERKAELARRKKAAEDEAEAPETEPEAPDPSTNNQQDAEPPPDED